MMHSKWMGWVVLLAGLTATHEGWLVQHARAANERAVFRCVTGDLTTFSDRPCDAAAEPYVFDPTRVTTYPAPVRPSPSIKSVDVRPQPKSRAQSDARDKLAEKCARMQMALKDIRSKMRSGYTAAEGERLRSRKSKLESERRAAKCRS
jgi:hypothetical protein